MTLLLLSILALCPILICPLAAQSQAPDRCCHKHHPPCPPQASLDCPYVVLEKGKTQLLGAYAVAALRPVAFDLLLVSSGVTQSDSYLPDAAGLYLRNRVLLI